MIACLLIPAYDLQAALQGRPRLRREPAALAPVPGSDAVIGSVTAAAEAHGVRAGMRLGEALAMCPRLVLVDPDPAAAEQAWEDILRRVEDAGFSVEPAEPGSLFFETKGIERLYGGLENALRRALAAVGSQWGAKVGAADRRFAALAAAGVARPGHVVVVSDERTREFLSPLPLGLLPLDGSRRRELDDLGIRNLGQLAALSGAAVAERLGADGREAWSLARGSRRGRVRGRRQPAEIVEALEFPEAIGNELTLRRAFTTLLDQLLARPERAGRFIRKLAVSARLATGGSWRRTVTLRDPTAERDRLKAALGPKLAELPSPAVELRLELVELTASTGQQLELVAAAGEQLDVRLQDGLRQVRASTGTGSVCSVVEVAPWSRIPEARALFVPRDE